MAPVKTWIVYCKEEKVMLVLSRREGERICIGDDVCLTVLEVRGKTVRLGFSGRPTVPIHREEVYKRIERESAGFPQTTRPELEGRTSA
jgi:carbon storage regulator